MEEMYNVWEWMGLWECIIGYIWVAKVDITCFVQESILGPAMDSQKVVLGDCVFDLKIHVFQGQVVNV